jgi:hypothetical protein
VELVNLTVDYKQKMYADDSYYEGELNEKGERHGFGTMRWKNGDWIQGDFHKDCFKIGRGRRTDGDEVKEGLWSDGLFWGRFEGTWSPDEPYSKGIVRYIGERAHGESYGAVYEGENKYHAPHGRGSLVYVHGVRWSGEWEMGTFRRGRYTFPNGNYYEGAFENLKFQGEGKFVSVTDGYTDEGLFRNGEIVWGKRIRRDDDAHMDIIYEGTNARKYIKRTIDGFLLLSVHRSSW